ncbi:MAG: hypothetical protein CVU77_02175 [Elusimicrobia bacterium HGW-Elusimicrobia-1]|jgi:cation:H+ antiporter|nr:MAG: hypothetical protein CVU77_02175 [Elusimicrobia bacterium HGW-Elusimicrobia-1]
MTVIIIEFALCLALVFWAGKNVAISGDALAQKTGLGGLWIGVVLMAAVTSLPEIFTGVGSIVFVGNPDLTFGDILGANTYNLLKIAVLDYFAVGVPILSAMSRGQTLTAWLSLSPLVFVIGGLLGAPMGFNASFLNISVWSWGVAISYAFSMRAIYLHEKDARAAGEPPQTSPAAVAPPSEMASPLKKIWIHFLLSAAVVVACGIWLAYIGDGFVEKMGWHSSFVGTLILGFATTMPEIAVSFAAMRIGAHEMAVANMIGSNLFNYAIIFVNDALYSKGDIFAALDTYAHLNTTGAILAMTVVVIIGMRLRSKRKLAAGFAWYSYLLAALFLAGAILNFSSK